MTLNIVKTISEVVELFVCHIWYDFKLYSICNFQQIWTFNFPL